MKAYKLFVLPLLAVLSAMLAITPAGSATDLPPGDDAKVTRVVAGDSIEVLISGTGFTIGYLGVDAPDPTTAKARAQCYGAQALAFNTRLVKGQTLRVEREVSDFDANGRLLRWVFLPDGRLVNEEIVKGGYALATTLTPDSKYRERLAAAQQAAQAARRGIWRACPALAQSTATPAVVPEVAPEAAPEAAPAGPVDPACPSPDVCILAPASGQSVYPGTVVIFKGTATDPAFVRYQFLAGNGSDWGHIADFRKPVVNGALMEFHTETVPAGTYTIRLQVIDNSGNIRPEKAEVVLIIGWGGSRLYTPVPETGGAGDNSGGGGGSGKSCCKICSKGKACGDSCISRSYTCHKGPGCACDG